MEEIIQEVQEFKQKLHELLQRRKFSTLLQQRALPGSQVAAYLQSRALSVEDIECYEFQGNFNYQGRDYQLPTSIVIPLRNTKGVLLGVWIRVLEEKRFYIWLVPNRQKYWLDIRQPGDPVYLAESIFDACSLRALYGFSNVGATLGVAASSDLVQELSMLPSSEVVLCFDHDSAGYQGMLRQLKHPHSQHWGVLMLKQGSESLESHENSDNLGNLEIDFKQLKDYNNIIKFMSDSGNKVTHKLEYRVLKGIQAQVYLKSKL